MLRVLPSFCFGVLLTGILSGTVRLWSQTGPVLSPALRFSAILALLAMVLSYLLVRRFHPLHSLKEKALLFFRVEGLTLSLLLFLITDSITTPFSWIAGPSARGLIMLFTVLCYLILRLQWETPYRKVIAVMAVLLPFLSFLTATDGHMLFSDDHPVFYYRLDTLKQMFPSIPFYMPWWNAGLDARDYFATGVLNIFFLFAPVIYLFPTELSYNFIISSTLFIIPPLANYFGARLLGYNQKIAFYAALISLSSSSLWLKWGLKFGTMGFCLSAALIPLLVALTTKTIATRGKISRPEIILLGITASLVIFWSLSGVALLPLVLITLFFAPRLLMQSRIRWLLLALFAFHLPWIAMFFEVSKPLEVATRSSTQSTHEFEATMTTSSETQQSRPAMIDGKPTVRARSHTFSTSGILRLIREKTSQVNPLVIFLLLPGIFLMRSRTERWLYSITIFWLLLLAFPLSPLKPQLEFERMVLVAFHLAALPVACSLHTLLIAATAGIKEQRPLYSALYSLSFAAALTGLCTTIAAVNGRSWEQYHLRPKQVSEFLDAVQTLPDQQFQDGSLGRIVWPGFMLHQFYEGHIAPLVLWLERPLAAMSPFHNLWWYQEFVPQEISAKGHEAIEEYLDLFRARSVIVIQDTWKKYVRKYPEIYTLHKEVYPFGIYTRKTGVDSYFIKGDGNVIREELDRVIFTTNTTDAIIAYRHFPFLIVKGCTVYPVNVAKDTDFIGLKNCPTGIQLTIESVSPFTRLAKGVLRVTASFNE